MENFWQDIRFGFRTLLRSPATSAVALLTLALGIGANTAIFSVVNGVLLQPLDFKDPEEIVAVWESNPGRGFPRFSTSPPNYEDWRRQNQVFEEMFATQLGRYNLTGGDRPESVLGAVVTPEFFSVLGVRPQLGRGILPEEGKPGGAKVAVLSQGLWQRRFGSDPDVLKQRIQVDGESYQIVGVMPEGFDFPVKREIWLPLVWDFPPDTRGAHFLFTIGRLKDGVTMERALTEMKTIASRLERQYPESNTGWTVTMLGVSDLVVEDVRPALLLLLAAVGFVLLIACANVANILLARLASREREIAVRAALGAGRIRLVRQMLTESLVLFLVGGLLGLLFAALANRVLLSLYASGLPRENEVGLDGRVLLFTLGLSLLTGFLFGLVPALNATSGRLYGALKEGGRAVAGGARGKLIRNLLVLGEVAIALVLLVGAGLLLRSFARLRAIEPGFRPEGVLSAQLVLPDQKYAEPERQIAFTRELLERVRAIPGVSSAGTSFPLPLGGGGFILAFTVDGKPAPAPGEQPNANTRVVSPDYFQTLGTRLLQGRPFTPQDGPDSVQVVIINKTMAEKIWPGENPIGKRITYDDPGDPNLKWREVIGVAEDVHHSGLEQDPGSEVYWPQLQSPVGGEVNVIVRTEGDPMRLAAPLRQVVSGIDADLPINRVRTMEEVVAESLSGSRFQTVLLGIFAGVALLLAAIGVYGVISYSVAQRTHEIGIRMALGARREEVLRLVIRQGMTLVLIGVAVGLVFAVLLSWWLSDQVAAYLYDSQALDPLILVTVPLVLLAVALVANWLPARRATMVDPLVALRRS